MKRVLIEVGVWLLLLTCAVPLALFLLFSTGCSTVSPDVVRASQAGFVDGVQDSGVKGQVQARSTGVHELTITASDRVEYNRLIKTWGTRAMLTHAPLHADDGLTRLPNGTYAIENDYFVDFGLMRDMQADPAMAPKK